MSAPLSFVLAACCAAAALSALRWLRVAQREHYLAGAATRFAWRWWGRGAISLALASAGSAAAVVSFGAPTASLITVVVFGLGPRGLTLRGRTGRLVWTRRLVTLAATVVVIAAVPIVLARVFDGDLAIGVAALVAVLIPAIVDFTMAVVKPFEDHLARVHVARAVARLGQVRPRIVAVTGSYGKTTTKGYIAHLLAGRLSVVASPRSFNNRAGLARAINEHVGLGTEVFVAEMGAYGPGEIAALCEWMPPEIAVITAIGPVHLERFKTLERTFEAKSEITERAATVVLNVDDERLSQLADRLEATKRVMRCSALRTDAEVAVIEAASGVEVFHRGERIGCLEELSGAPSNIALACAVGFAFGCTEEELLERLRTLPVPEHRLTPSASEGGVLVLDDTFNANPAGTRRALSTLAKSGDPESRRVVVSPGMVELGALQDAENAAFAAAAARVASHVVVVNTTNRQSLLSGLEASARAGAIEVVTVRDRDDAVAWVRGSLHSGDVVLYENDLPDHYP